MVSAILRQPWDSKVGFCPILGWTLSDGRISLAVTEKVAMAAIRYLSAVKAGLLDYPNLP